MSDNEINLLMTVMNKGFERVEGAIQVSRQERQAQVSSIQTSLGAQGERIAKLETSHKENMDKHHAKHPADKQIEIPVPFTGGKSIKGESRDILRIAAIVLMGFLIYMSFTDRDERAQLRDELKQWKQTQQIDRIDVPKTALIK